ncbi:MAG: NHL repeat-containing protein, partial [Proteobacteria bacterium]|nr:NHL repeat-containing protein [Pseudomonadota bacterium]
DSSEILADMSLDFDRNAVLDSCQDCDGNGIPDLVEIDGANAMWAVASTNNIIRQYHPITGVMMHEGTPGVLNAPTDLVITDDRRILVASSADDRIVEFDKSGNYVKDFIASGVGGLDEPTALLIHDGGFLYVSSAASNSVLRYDIVTGEPLGAFVATGEGGLRRPYGMEFTPEGNLLVSSQDNRILEFNTSGALERVFVNSTNNGGLTQPRDILYTPDGTRVIVASKGTDQVLAYDPTDGTFVGEWINGTYRGKLNGPWGMSIGPDGNVYIGASDRRESAGTQQLHLTDPRIFLYEGSTGNLWFPYVQARDSLLKAPMGFAFMPGQGPDRPAWVVQARAGHEAWNMDEDRPGAVPVTGGVVLAALGQLGPDGYLKAYLPDLSAARLTLTHLATVSLLDGRGEALHAGYRGTRGCKVSLLILADGAALPKALTRYDDRALRTYAWQTGEHGYLLVAEGMDEARLAMIAETVHRATLEHSPFDVETRTALRESRERSKPCLA